MIKCEINEDIIFVVDFDESILNKNEIDFIKRSVKLKEINSLFIGSELRITHNFISWLN